MTVVDLSKLNDGAKIEPIRVIISDKKVLPKSDGSGNYLSLEIQDLTGKMGFPVWDDVEFLDSKLEVGMIVDVAEATIGSWKGTKQLKTPKFHILTEEELKEVDMSQLVPSYKIPKELITEMETLIDEMMEPWKTFALHATGALGTNPERWKAFLECPSAEKHHGNKRGGLFLHTYGVIRSAEASVDSYVRNPFFYDAKEVIIPSRMRLKALIHDIEKIHEYEYATCIRRKPDRPLGHIYDGVTLLAKVNAECNNILSEKQIEDLSWAILTHHGQWGPEQPETPEEWILHLADMVDSKIVGYLEK